MDVLRDRAALREWRERLPTTARIGFVPTMGNLHAGHLALVKLAQSQAAVVIVSIFVNPLQFNDPADLARYPRTEAADLAVLEAAGVDAVFMPDAADLLTLGLDAVRIEPGLLAERWEGAARPGHFAGMATIVAKLFHLVAPQFAVFGQKDFQQLVIVRAMVQSLNFPLEIIAGETVRAEDGLALSSRNRFLTAAERQIAPFLHQQLQAAAAAIRAGDEIDAVLQDAHARLGEAGFVVEYFALCDQRSLAPTVVPEGAVLLTAARLGAVRLLDNLLL
ncbi:pantoate--beta-alanine ligase [Halothiobacillus sp. DCM-1]|uniref:pantoate--beta-alanine ligase n=1 Tax=Halothiobacillus sp. DCM-1 TaxID=3112558 RepID=UPI00324A361A